MSGSGKSQDLAAIFERALAPPERPLSFVNVIRAVRCGHVKVPGLFDASGKAFHGPSVRRTAARSSKALGLPGTATFASPYPPSCRSPPCRFSPSERADRLLAGRWLSYSSSGSNTTSIRLEPPRGAPPALVGPTPGSTTRTWLRGLRRLEESNDERGTTTACSWQ